MRRASREQARDYCKKIETRVEGPWELGKWAVDGRRKDLGAAIEAIQGGACTKDVALNHPEIYVQFHNGITKLIGHHTPKRSEAPRVHWVWGPSGSGKSRWAHETFPEAYTKKPNNKWWDGYDRHAAVIIDDYKGGFAFGELLTLLDRYPVDVEIKGAQIPMIAVDIIVTSIHPPEFYVPPGEDPFQLQRRITFLREMEPCCNGVVPG